MVPGDRVRFRAESDCRSDFPRPVEMPGDGDYTVEIVWEIQGKTYVRCFDYAAWIPQDALEVCDES